MNFYDHFASEYEAAVGQGERVAAANAFIERLQRMQPFDSLLDVACGTGLYALAAARQGVPRVSGVDLSAGMLEIARKHAAHMALPVDFLHRSMDDLTPLKNARFAAVLCMGNSLPHLTGDEQLRQALREFARVLRPDGLLALHILNYEKISTDRDRVVGAVKHEAVEHIRFYDFIDPLVRFNILRLDWSQTPPSTRLESTVLKPFVKADILAALNDCGFRNARLFGGLDLTPFAVAHSDSLLVVANRSTVPENP